MREVQPGLWHWQAPHPDWTPAQRWPQMVSSSALDDGERLLLFDPQSVPDELLALTQHREPVVVLTAPWHERDTRSLVDRFGATVYAPVLDTVQDLVDKFGVTPDEAAGGSPDLRWLAEGAGAAHWFTGGDRLPIGIEAYTGREHNDLVLYIESHRAIITGDTLVDFGGGFGMNEWLRGGVTREQVVERLTPLLALPIDVVLPAHGAPTDRASLAQALGSTT